MKKLKTLSNHNGESHNFHYSLSNNEPVLNGIACPECGEELYDSSPMTTLTSDPPQKDIRCNNCNYSGYRIA